MRSGALLVVLGISTACLHAQDCPATARLWPAATISASLDGTNYVLNGGAAYAGYRLDLPVRGQIQLDLTTDAGFTMILRDASGARVDGGGSIHRSLEAGSYTVLVSASMAGQGGAYSLKSNFT